MDTEQKINLPHLPESAEQRNENREKLGQLDETIRWKKFLSERFKSDWEASTFRRQTEATLDALEKREDAVTVKANMIRYAQARMGEDRAKKIGLELTDQVMTALSVRDIASRIVEERLAREIESSPQRMHEMLRVIVGSVNYMTSMYDELLLCAGTMTSAFGDRNRSDYIGEQLWISLRKNTRERWEGSLFFRPLTELNLEVLNGPEFARDIRQAMLQVIRKVVASEAGRNVGLDRAIRESGLLDQRTASELPIPEIVKRYVEATMSVESPIDGLAVISDRQSLMRVNMREAYDGFLKAAVDLLPKEKQDRVYQVLRQNLDAAPTLSVQQRRDLHMRAAGELKANSDYQRWKTKLDAIPTDIAKRIQIAMAEASKSVDAKYPPSLQATKYWSPEADRDIPLSECLDQLIESTWSSNAWLDKSAMEYDFNNLNMRELFDSVIKTLKTKGDEEALNALERADVSMF